MIRGPARTCVCVTPRPPGRIRTRTHRGPAALYYTSLSHPLVSDPSPISLSRSFFPLSPSFSPLSVYARTQIPRVDVGTVISPESKAPASGVGTSVREFLNPFLHDSCSAWPGLRLCPDLACCWLRVVGRYRRGTAARLYRVFRDVRDEFHSRILRAVWRAHDSFSTKTYSMILKLRMIELIKYFLSNQISEIRQ